MWFSINFEKIIRCYTTNKTVMSFRKIAACLMNYPLLYEVARGSSYKKGLGSGGGGGHERVPPKVVKSFSLALLFLLYPH
jgi:hypothetical protein